MGAVGLVSLVVDGASVAVRGFFSGGGSGFFSVLVDVISGFGRTSSNGVVVAVVGGWHGLEATVGVVVVVGGVATTVLVAGDGCAGFILFVDRLVGGNGTGVGLEAACALSCCGRGCLSGCWCCSMVDLLNPDSGIWRLWGFGEDRVGIGSRRSLANLIVLLIAEKS